MRDAIDYSWLVEACGNDPDRLNELTLLLSAGGTLASAYAQTELHARRIRGYHTALIILSEKLGHKEYADEFRKLLI